jgi:hypothetical protein
LTAKLGNLRFGQLINTTLASPMSDLKMFLTDKSIEDLWILITWGK